MPVTVWVPGDDEPVSISVPQAAKVQIQSVNQELIMLLAPNGQVVGAFARQNIYGAVADEVPLG